MYYVAIHYLFMYVLYVCSEGLNDGQLEDNEANMVGMDEDKEVNVHLQNL